MSSPEFSTNNPHVTREAVINQILTSIAMEELGLSHIINAEGEKLQYALGTLEGASPAEPATIEELLELNKSIRDTLDSTMQNQMFLKAKMQSALAATIMQGPAGPTGSPGSPGSPGPFLSSYMEALGDEQTILQNAVIIFDLDSVDNEGNNIVLSNDGKVFTINKPGLYHIEWSINLADSDYSTPAVVGIIENNAPASGASCSSSGSFSSGTIINVDSTPFTIELFNFGNEIKIDRHRQFIDSAASIRIVRFADGPSE